MLFIFLVVCGAFISIFSSIFNIGMIIPSVLSGLIYNKIAGVGYTIIPSVGDLGIVFMMTSIGTHINFNFIRKNIKSVFAILGGTILSSIVVFFVVKNMLCLDLYNSILISMSMCLSSTMICHSELLTGNRISSEYGKLSMIATIIQDIIGVFLIVACHSKVIDNQLYLSYFILLAIILILLFLKHRIKSGIMSMQDKYNPVRFNTIFISFVIILYILSNYLEINFCLSKELIFFAVGYIFKFLVHQYIVYIDALQYIFMSSFIFYISSILDINIILNNFKLSLEIMIIVSVIKIIINYIFLSRSIKSIESSFNTSILISSFSETMFYIVPSLKIDRVSMNIIMVSVILSLICIPFIFRIAVNMFENIRSSRVGIAKYSARLYLTDLKEHVIVIGIGKYTDKFVTMISDKLLNVVVVDNDIEKVLDMNSNNYYFIDLRIADTYKAINNKKPISIIVNVNDSSLTLHIMSMIKKEISHNIDVYVMCKQEDIEEIGEYGGYPIIVDSNMDHKISDVADRIYERAK